MRSNGLTAATYTPVADLDPAVAETLLEDLRAQGVAAYAKPVESTSAGGFDRLEFRVGVKERLYVDSAASARVRELIESVDPDLLADNEDLTWAQLVAGFDRPIDKSAVPWPVDEDLTRGEPEHVVDERDLADPAPEVPEAGPQRRWGSRPDRLDTSDDDDFLFSTVGPREVEKPDPEDRFVPEPPPPLPQLPPFKIIAWAGLIGGPLVLIFSALFSYQLSALFLTLAVGGFVGGFVTLVATMTDDDDDHWDPGNGAVL
jgi:hypothetical protein